MSGREIVTHLRISVMVAYVLIWNGLLFLGIWLGGRGLSYDSPIAEIMLLVALIGTALFALSVAHSSWVQSVVLRSRSNLPGLRIELWFIAILTAFLSLMTLMKHLGRN